MICLLRLHLSGTRRLHDHLLLVCFTHDGSLVLCVIQILHLLSVAVSSLIK